MGSIPKQADVVIIGGGVIGVSIAYYLAKRGIGRVVLFEKDILGSGSTGKCAGGIRTQFSTDINIDFSLASLKVFEQFQAEFGVDPEFHPVGYLFLAARENQWSLLRANARLIQAKGVRIELMTPDEIKGHWPFIRVDDILGGSFTVNDGYAGPHEVLQGFAAGARRLGVIIKEGVAVAGVQIKKGRVQAVECATGERVITSVVVNAAGPAAAEVGAMVGIDLPVRPLKRHLFFTENFDELPDQFPLTIDMEQSWYMRREGKGLLLAGPQDSNGSLDIDNDFEAREWTARRSVRRVPVLEHAGIAGGWTGLYEISPDHHAIIGSWPEAEGFVCANGFSGHGFMHSPAVGMAVAELISEGESRTLDIRPFSPLRFREGNLIHEPMTAFQD
ncbi:NAD(P)/FAD-dependent oxidoreductase [Thermodesulfobacteriota bacterium]